MSRPKRSTRAVYTIEYDKQNKAPVAIHLRQSADTTGYRNDTGDEGIDTDLRPHIECFFQSISQTFRVGKLSIDTAANAAEAKERLDELKGKLERYRHIARTLTELNQRQNNRLHPLQLLQ